MLQLSAIKAIEMAAHRMGGVVSLAQGTPSLHSHDLIRKAVVEAIHANAVDKYSLGMGMAELRQAIADSLAREGMHYDKDKEIIVCAGSIEALSAVCLAELERGDEVMLVTPTYYANYKSIVEMAGGVPVAVQLDEEEGWRLNLETLRSTVTAKTKMVILCSPNNPTGSVLSQEELMHIGELAKKRNLLLVFDDVYYKLVYEKEFFSLATKEKYREHILRIGSFSKTFALTGWRIGFLHGPENVVSRILPVHDNLVNCAPVVSQHAALAALQHEEEIVPEVFQEYKKRRELMRMLLEEMKEHLSFRLPEGAYYFFPKVHGVENTVEFAFDVLERAKVAVVPGEDFGPGGEGHIRLCFGRSPEDIVEGLVRLKIYFEKWKSR